MLKAPRGTKDILPEEVAKWRKLEDTARAVFESNGYGEIRTPIFELTGLFTRSIGETTDIVEKEMYTFAKAQDKESITLRPEATAPVVRAYVEHSLFKSKAFRKFYYIGPMFRYERPQAGRQRQFHQLGVEALGSCDPLLDAEMILITQEILRRVGAGATHVKINSCGCPACRPAWRARLKDELAGARGALCPDCLRRYERNVFRILDCKNP
ncbi:MAG: histidine--tRNA ligase, partial [Planctomycetota bacterium]